MLRSAEIHTLSISAAGAGESRLIVFLEMVEWVFFNVVMPLLAVPIVWFLSWVGNGETRSMEESLGGGDLLFYCLVVTSAVLGDVYMDGNPDNKLYMIGLILLLVISTVVYGSCVNNSDMNKKR